MRRIGKTTNEYFHVFLLYEYKTFSRASSLFNAIWTKSLCVSTSNTCTIFYMNRSLTDVYTEKTIRKSPAASVYIHISCYTYGF